MIKMTSFNLVKSKLRKANDSLDHLGSIVDYFENVLLGGHSLGRLFTETEKEIPKDVRKYFKRVIKNFDKRKTRTFLNNMNDVYNKNAEYLRKGYVVGFINYLIINSSVLDKNFKKSNIHEIVTDLKKFNKVISDSKIPKYISKCSKSKDRHIRSLAEHTSVELRSIQKTIEHVYLALASL